MNSKTLFADYRRDFSTDGGGGNCDPRLTQTMDPQQTDLDGGGGTDPGGSQIKGGPAMYDTHIIVNPVQQTPAKRQRLDQQKSQEPDMHLVRPYDTVQTTSISATNSPFTDKKSLLSNRRHQSHVHPQVKSLEIRASQYF